MKNKELKEILDRAKREKKYLIDDYLKTIKVELQEARYGWATTSIPKRIFEVNGLLAEFKEFLEATRH